VLLHVLIGIAIGVVVMFASAFVLIAASPAAAERDVGDDAMAAVWFVVSLAAGIGSWICFVYLNRPLGQRWLAFVGIAALGTVVAAISIGRALVAA
jgi:hypothetical protein